VGTTIACRARSLPVSPTASLSRSFWLYGPGSRLVWAFMSRPPCATLAFPTETFEYNIGPADICHHR
jgi:hypothetical protein